jgi:phage baseplate assembly protein W
MSNAFFTGFSTVDSEKTRRRVFYDLELCKRDLMNHFLTRPGERVMRPDWGCRVWDYIMEPMTEGLREIIVGQVTAIVHADSRCQIVNVAVDSSDHGVVVTITMNFIPQAVVDTFAVSFEARDAKFFQ